MSLEQVLSENTAALNANNELLKQLIAAQSGSTEKASTAKTSTAKTSTAKTKKADVVDPDTLKAKLVEFKTLTDMKTAKALVKDQFGYDAIADVPDDKSKEVFDAIQAAITAIENGETAGDDEGL